MTDQDDELEQIRARHEADCGFESDGMDSAEWRAALTMLATRAHTDRATLLALLDAARAELAAVREAAGPFAKLWEDVSFGNPYAPIDQMVWREGEADHGRYQITYGDLRRLAAALKGSGHD